MSYQSFHISNTTDEEYLEKTKSTEQANAYTLLFSLYQKDI